MENLNHMKVDYRKENEKFINSVTFIATAKNGYLCYDDAKKVKVPVEDIVEAFNNKYMLVELDGVKYAPISCSSAGEVICIGKGASNAAELYIIKPV